MSAEGDKTRWFYGNVLPYMPGPSMVDQVTKAKETIKKIGLKEASPGKMFNAGDVDELAKHFDEGYKNSVGKRIINITDEWSGPHRVTEDISRIVRKYIDNDSMAGTSIGAVRRKLANLVDKNFDDVDYKNVLQQFDQKIVDDLTRGGKKGLPTQANQEILDAYAILNDGYDNFRNLLNKADEVSGKSKGVIAGAKGLARNIFQKLAAHAVIKTVLEIGVGGALAGPMTGALAVGAIPLGTKVGQRYMTGGTGWQKLTRKGIEDPRVQRGLMRGGQKAGMMGTSAGAAGVTEDKYGSY